MVSHPDLALEVETLLETVKFKSRGHTYLGKRPDLVEQARKELAEQEERDRRRGERRKEAPKQ